MTKNPKLLTIRWKYIKGTDKTYKVSEIGEVRKVLGKGKERLVAQFMIDNRYFCSLTVAGKRRTLSVARLVAEAFLRKPKNSNAVFLRHGNLPVLENIYWSCPSDKALKRRVGKYYAFIKDNKIEAVAKSFNTLSRFTDLTASELKKLYEQKNKKGKIRVVNYEFELDNKRHK